MVGMFGGVKLGGGGKLVMGEVCRIRIRKSVAVSLNLLKLGPVARLLPLPKQYIYTYTDCKYD